MLRILRHPPRPGRVRIIILRRGRGNLCVSAALKKSLFGKPEIVEIPGGKNKVESRRPRRAVDTIELPRRKYTVYFFWETIKGPRITWGKLCSSFQNISRKST